MNGPGVVAQTQGSVGVDAERDAFEVALGGARGVDAAALADILHRLSQLAENLPELAELDLNPVLGLPDGAIAVDARIRLARPTAPSVAKTW